MRGRGSPGGCILIEVVATPNSKKEGLEYADGVLKARVKEPADRGKANKAVTKLVSGIFGECTLVSGFTSRRKTFLAKTQTAETLSILLESLHKRK